MKPVVWFKHSYGLNNKVDPVRIIFDPESGANDLAEAVNVVHDRTGAISRRLGWTVTDITSECHSLFWDGGECLFVTGDALSILGSDFTSTPIRNVTRGALMSYAQVGNKIYYMNGSERGFVYNSFSYDWSMGTARYPDTTRSFIDPPIGNIVRLFNGRILIGKGSTCWYSEPFGYNFFDPVRGNFSLPAEITMIRPVEQGVFVSTVFKTYFYQGITPPEFVVKEVSQYPAILGTDVMADGSNVLDGEISRNMVALWVSKEGVCVGAPDGTVINLTNRRLTYPYSLRGASLYTGERFVFSLEE